MHTGKKLSAYLTEYFSHTFLPCIVFNRIFNLLKDFWPSLYIFKIFRYNKEVRLCEIWGFHCDEDDDDVLGFGADESTRRQNPEEQHLEFIYICRFLLDAYKFVTLEFKWESDCCIILWFHGYK
jgi:hypothetical protein